MKVAAYQAPLAASRTDQILPLIREQVDRCEALGVEILCCPEAVLGGLADYAERPSVIAIDVEGGGLEPIARALASDVVTTIVGFTEGDRDGRLFNAAAILARGSVAGIYRKLHPAINRSVYHPGSDLPTFTAGSLTFGVLICYDSTFAEPIAALVSKGARAVFIPTNNGMPVRKGGAELVPEARAIDVAHARKHGVSIVRADVVGHAGDLTSFGSSGIVAPNGDVLVAAAYRRTDLLVGTIP
jgi:predicted amidohydrolase